MEIDTMGFKISQEQEEDLKFWGQKFEQLVKRYQIYDVIDSEAAEGVANDRVFSLQSGWDYPGGDWKGVVSIGWQLVAGFYEGANAYYLAQVPFDEKLDTGYRELRVSCIVCDGNAEIQGGEECENCERGELVFELFWNENFVVSIDLSPW